MSASPSPTILLLGAQGQVGRALREPLGRLGRVVVGSRHAEPGDASVAVDLADLDRLTEVVRRVAPRWIVNAAAYTAVDRAESEPELAWQINAQAPGRLAEVAREIGAALVHYSTDYVFDGSGERPWRESDTTGPLNEYGRSKLAGERAIIAADVPHVILRTSWVYAPGGTNFVRTMLRLGSTRRELRVVADQIGAPTSADVIADVTARIMAAAQVDGLPLLRERGGIVHLACRGATSWHGFATTIFEQARSRGAPLIVERVDPIATADYPTPARRPLNSRLDLSQLAERFGLQTPAWDEALAAVMPAMIDELNPTG